ncbi:MAG: hypothetical protein FJ267_13040, partial [Planctomycetes bacterium]|nr:hypothetical protein [Planctomycetota bacterium]
MKIEEFSSLYGQNVQPIDAVCQKWTFSEIDLMLQKLDHDFVGATVVIGDALHGDGIRDQIPNELRDAFAGLYREKADTYAQMRAILAEKVGDGNGGFLSLNDPRVLGFINKLKGQIGENEFQRHVGAVAQLAKSGSQEAWDVAVSQPDGAHEYVQVKLYTDPNNVIEHMRAVQEKVAAGLIEGIDGEKVEHINFAIPENIANEVQRRIADRFPELADVKLHTIPLSAKAGAEFVEEGLNNVGPEQLEHLFDELFGGFLVAGSLHAIVNGFLWYKGAKESSTALNDTIANTALSAAGIGIGLLAETLTCAVPVSAVVAIGGRAVVSRFARSRWNF